MLTVNSSQNIKISNSNNNSNNNNIDDMFLRLLRNYFFVADGQAIL